MADTWMPAGPVGFVSPDLCCWMEIYPATQRHAGRWRARAFFYRVEKGSEGFTFRKLWSRDLVNAGMFDPLVLLSTLCGTWSGDQSIPLNVFIAPDGNAIVTLDEYMKLGDKNALVIYSGKGKPVRKWKLSDLFSRSFIRQNFRWSFSGIRWRDGAEYYYSRDGRYFALRLKMQAWAEREAPLEKVLLVDLRAGGYTLGDTDLITEDCLPLDSQLLRGIGLGSDTVTDRVVKASENTIRLERPPWKTE